MTERSPFGSFKTSPEGIRPDEMLCMRAPLSFWNVEDLLHERGIEASDEPVRLSWQRFGPKVRGGDPQEASGWDENPPAGAGTAMRWSYQRPRSTTFGAPSTTKAASSGMSTFDDLAGLRPFAFERPGRPLA